MGYQFIKHMLITHFPDVFFPDVLKSQGYLECACGWSTTDRDPDDLIDRWADHVEKEWNG